MKKYQLMVSRVFPFYHSKAGMQTNFLEKITNKEKLHTLRSNYKWWKRRIESVQDGDGYLSIRIWSGLPYVSKQIEVEQLTNVGIQKLELIGKVWLVDDQFGKITVEQLAANDGLSLEDFTEWFASYQSGPMAIIHFTDFRY